ncbi:MAG: peptidyl-prolyl cis-trans isomerase [Bdellovibrionales bacterium]|nr:peptidyl-prolyl cis-trans isomerase [Bdellovibrionales bacterium]
MAALCLLPLFFLVACKPGEKKATERIVVKVNDTTLNAKDFANRLAKKLSAYDALTAKDADTILATKESVVDEFLLEVITRRYARENDIFVKKEDLDAKINSIRQIYPDDLAFRRSLAEEGLEFKDWKNQIEYSILESKVANAINQSITPPADEEIKAYYDRNKENYRRPAQVYLRQVVTASEINAKRIVEALKKGRSMTDLAKEFSITPEGKSGGEIGWIEKGAFEYFDTAFTMRVGQKSGPIKSPFGYHVFVVEKSRHERLLALSDVKDQIRGILIERRQQAAYTSWLEMEIRKTRVYKDQEFLNHLQVETRS